MQSPENSIPVSCKNTPFGIRIDLCSNAEEQIIHNEGRADNNQPLESTYESILQNRDKYVKQVIGYMPAAIQFEELVTAWHDPSPIIVATDGGLKGSIGTHGYVMVQDGSTDLLVSGFGAEKAMEGTLTSTREELIAMLAIQYLINIFQEWIGCPKNGEFIVITDSEAAKTIRGREIASYDSAVFLKQEMDVEMEIRRMEKLSKLEKMEIIWTKSHVDGVSDNPYYSALNEMADQLATKAREGVIKKTIKQQIYHLFPGNKIALSINGYLVHNNRKSIIRRECHQAALKQYLINKFEWEERTFQMIEWTSFGRALKSYKETARPGLIKYIHGWQFRNRQKRKFGLATLEGSVEKCPWCNEEEEVGHEFKCTSATMTRARKAGWRTLKRRMAKCTTQEVLHKLWLGFHSVTENHAPESGQKYTTEEVRAASAFDEQTRIGWPLFLRGYITADFGRANYEATSEGERKMDPVTWTTKLIKEIWVLGLDLWKQRNMKVHGSEYISIEEKVRIAERITELYTKIKPKVSPTDEWLFNKSVKKRLEQSYMAQVGWVEQVESHLHNIIKNTELVTTRKIKHIEYCKTSGIIGREQIF